MGMIAASRDNFTGVDHPETPADEFDADAMINLFNRAFVDDTFEKIKLQIADLNIDGQITGSDVDLITQFTYTPENNPTAEQRAVFDFDTNGVLDANDGDVYINVLLLLWIGDANANGIFNSSDLVQVLTAGEYEDAMDDNSMWSEGDWDFDHDFATSDLVAAFAGSEFADILRLNMFDDDGDGVVDETDEILLAYRPGMAPVWFHLGTDVSALANGALYFPVFSNSVVRRRS